MAYWHVNRILDHTEVRGYRNEEGKTKRIKQGELLTALAIARRLPSTDEGKVSRRELFSMTGIRQPKTIANNLENLTQAGLIEKWRYSNESYTFALGSSLDCENNGCLEPAHYQDKKNRGLENRTKVDKPHRGVRETKPLSLENPNIEVRETKLHIRTKELNNLNNPEETEIVLEVEPDIPKPVTRQPSQSMNEVELDPETTAKRDRAKEGLERELEKRGNPTINPNLQSHAIISRAMDINVLDRAIELSAKGYDLDPQGKKWRAGSQNIESELIRVGVPTAVAG